MLFLLLWLVIFLWWRRCATLLRKSVRKIKWKSFQLIKSRTILLDLIKKKVTLYCLVHIMERVSIWCTLRLMTLSIKSYKALENVLLPRMHAFYTALCIYKCSTGNVEVNNNSEYLTREWLRGRVWMEPKLTHWF